MSPAYTVIDPSVLYAASGHDLALFRSLSQIFLDSAPAMLERMRQAAQRGPGEQADFIAASHSLRGITALVGARALTALLADLESQAKLGVCATGTALDAAGGALAQVCAEVAHSIASYPGAAP